MKTTRNIRIFVFAVCVTVSLFSEFDSVADSQLFKTNSYDGGWLRGIFRVNTDVSAGDESLSTVCDKAESASLNFIVVSDQFLVRAEYGIWPLRRTISSVVERKSVVEFGIERYLSLINAEDAARADLVLIPGVDVAPHYYWNGFPFTRNFKNRQFSEQLTVFGSSNPQFYRNLPVMHNETNDFSVHSILKMLPLLLVVWGIFMLFHLRVDAYRDSTGKLLSSRINKSRLVLALFLIPFGILWTFENRPFTHYLGFDQYSDKGIRPYQKLIDYVNANGGFGKAGVLWSAPEAATSITIMNTSLETKPYLSDVVMTFGHNGMAGLYGDAITALRPGGEWDAMLLEYCAGKRDVRPIVVGELDYHGRKRRIDMYQTVVRGAEKSREAIFNAIIAGRSYAYAKSANCEIELVDAYVSDGIEIARLGDTLKIAENAKSLVAKLSLRITGKSCADKNGEIRMIVNGKLLGKKKFNGLEFSGEFPIDVKSLSTGGKDLGYVRFDISSCGGRVVTNPIFIKSRL